MCVIGTCSSLQNQTDIVVIMRMDQWLLLHIVPRRLDRGLIFSPCIATALFTCTQYMWIFFCLKTNELRGCGVYRRNVIIFFTDGRCDVTETPIGACPHKQILPSFTHYTLLPSFLYFIPNEGINLHITIVQYCAKGVDYYYVCLIYNIEVSH